MSWKSLVTAGLLCVVAVPVFAAPQVRVTSLNDLTTPAGADRQWLVEIIPDGGASLPSALAVELAFTHTAGSSTQPVGIVNPSADNTNGAAGDTWYYNETAAGSGTVVWNITGGTSGFPLDPANEAQNPGDNPFTGTETEGLYINGANLFASLGSTLFAAGTTAVNTLHIVTDGRGGILNLGSSEVAQAGGLFPIAATSFYVPGDFSGDGVVGSADYDLILEFFGQTVSTVPGKWDGRPPVNGVSATSADYDRLLANFGSGTASGGAGGIAGLGVPEPSSVLLLFLGMVAVGTRRRR